MLPIDLGFEIDVISKWGFELSFRKKVKWILSMGRKSQDPENSKMMLLAPFLSVTNMNLEALEASKPSCER